MDKPLRFGLIGAGGVGAYHLAAIRRLEAFGAARVAAIAEPSAVCRTKTIEVGMAGPNTPWYENYLDLLDGDHDLDDVETALLELTHGAAC